MKPIICSLVFILFNISLLAQNGVLDPSFGVNGSVILDINDADNASRAIAIQPDGKILLGGYSTAETNVFNVVRLNPDGSPDIDFGENGVVNTALPFTAIASSIAIQSDGKIVAGGHTWGGEHNEFTVVRYLTDGSLDDTFGESGIVTTPFQDKSGFGRSLVIQDDGKIILAGLAYTIFNDLDDFALVRYHTDGRVDSTFGNNGIVFTDFVAAQDWIQVVRVQPDGKIVAAGFSAFRMALVRYLEDGSLDQSFGDNGLVADFISSSSQDGINGLAFSDDGIYVCGYSVDPTSNSFLAMFDYNGARRPDFGVNGIIINNLMENDRYDDIIIKGDKLAVGGNATGNDTFNFTFSQFTLDGAPVESFGTNGVFMVAPADTFNQLEAIAVQEDGKILGAGFTQYFPHDLAVVRVLSNTTVSAEEWVSESDIKLYPNPTSDIVHVYSESLTGLDEIILVDVTGKELASLRWVPSAADKNELLINLLRYPAGIYFLSFRNGEQSHVHKIVKE